MQVWSGRKNQWEGRCMWYFFRKRRLNSIEDTGYSARLEFFFWWRMLKSWELSDYKKYFRKNLRGERINAYLCTPNCEKQDKGSSLRFFFKFQLTGSQSVRKKENFFSKKFGDNKKGCNFAAPFDKKKSYGETKREKVLWEYWSNSEAAKYPGHNVTQEKVNPRTFKQF